MGGELALLNEQRFVHLPKRISNQSQQKSFTKSEFKLSDLSLHRI